MIRLQWRDHLLPSPCTSSSTAQRAPPDIIMLNMKIGHFLLSAWNNFDLCSKFQIADHRGVETEEYTEGKSYPLNHNPRKETIELHLVANLK